MALSTFDGDPGEQLHEHYDAEGNLTGTTVVTVPGWTDADRTWALALRLRESQQCPNGHHLPESSSDDWQWRASDPLICMACLALDTAAAKRKNLPESTRRASLFYLKKFPRPRPKKRG